MVKIGGIFRARLYDRKGRMKWDKTFLNDVVDVGLDNILGVHFSNVPATANWFAGLIDLVGFSALANGDVLSAHAGWAEFSGYSGNRKAGNFQTVLNQNTEFTGSADFVFTEAAVIKGIFVTDQATGVSGLLWATGLFTSGDQTIGLGETLKVDYSITIARA